MNKPILVYALLVGAAAVVAAQVPSSQQNPYQGKSNPPKDDVITTSAPPEAKPPAGQPYVQPQDVQPAAPAVPVPTIVPDQPQAAPVGVPVNSAVTGDDSGIVGVAPSTTDAGAPGLAVRTDSYDPDGDIVHPHPLRPGELAEGTTIRVHLLQGLSTANSESGEPFRTQVATDVLQGGAVLIPAGSEIDGKVVQVSSGHPGGHGSMRLQPETVVLPNGTRYRLFAETTGTPGSRTHVAGEGDIVPDSRMKRDGIEYGGAVGAGAVTGAIVGGPVGALTGSLIGAGVITAHLLINHPQATLESGTTLLFTLTEPLDLVAAQAGAGGN